MQSELGRHEQQIAKIQYEERKQAIERAFHAVTPLKRNKNGLNRSATGYGSPESSFRGDMSGGTNGNNSGIMNRAGASESLGSANGVLDELELVAYMRIIPKGVLYDQVSFGRILVKKEYRQAGIGQEMIQRAIDMFSNTEIILMSAQSYLKNFYSRFGFKSTGEEYLEDDIPHVQMYRK